MDNQKFVATVRRICKAKGLSVSQVENDLGWSAGLISRWNKACPSIEKVAELIAYLGVPFEELLGDSQSAGQSASTQVVEKLVEWTQKGTADWHLCKEDANVVKLVTMLEIEDASPELSYFYAYHKGYFLLVMTENGNLPLSLRLYLSPDKNTAPCLESDDSEKLALLLYAVDRELYHAWAVNKANQFRQEFLADDIL